MYRTAQRCEWLLPAALQMAELLITQLATRDGHAPASAAMSASGAGAAASGAAAPADTRITMNRFASALATATQRVSHTRTRTLVRLCSSLSTLHERQRKEPRSFLHSCTSSADHCSLSGSRM